MKEKVAIVMGSTSDLPTMREAQKALSLFGIKSEVKILSAHRTPKEMVRFAEQALQKNFQIIIAGAGGAAHLPGMLAALTPLPVIGVPVPIGPLCGLDSLLSIAQMPKGVPVATVAIGQAFNAGLLAAQMIAAGTQNTKLFQKIISYKKKLRHHVLKKARSVK